MHTLQINSYFFNKYEKLKKPSSNSNCFFLTVLSYQNGPNRRIHVQKCVLQTNCILNWDCRRQIEIAAWWPFELDGARFFSNKCNTHWVCELCTVRLHASMVNFFWLFAKKTLIILNSVALNLTSLHSFLITSTSSVFFYPIALLNFIHFFGQCQSLT